MKKHTLLSCALAVLLSGCGALHKNVQLSSDQEADLAKHVISVDRDGGLKLIENGKVKDTVICDSNSQGKTENNRKCDGYLDGIIKGIEEFKSGKQDAEVLFFVHGGLNKEGEAMERAGQQLALIHHDDKYNNIYPIFVLWESDGLETYIDHLIRIRQGEASEAAKFTSPIYLLTDIGNSIVNAPKSWLVNGDHMLHSTILSGDREDKLSTDIKNSGVEQMMSYAETEDNQPINIVRRMQWILGSPSKAVVTPFAYTMAKPAWDIMLRRTNTLFYTPEDLKLQEESITKSAIPVRKPGSGALYSVLEKLKDVKDINITLVGHSMGAIVVNKIVLLEPKLPYKNIVHMASADSINNLFNMVVPYINYSIEKKKDECPIPKKDSPECTEWVKGQAVNFYSLMLHPDNEDREEAWNSLVPSGSLLTWIDNMYTSPETVLDKRSGRWDNIKSSIKFLPTEVAKNMHFKIFGLGLNKGEKCDEEKFFVALGLKDEGYKKCDKPQKHGDFDRMHFWDEATWK